ncbi:MAG: hypothetical protein ACRD0K_10595 [Egibacteraceae bacterium]
MGLGLDRLLLLREGLDDIRLPRSTAPCVAAQMLGLAVLIAGGGPPTEVEVALPAGPRWSGYAGSARQGPMHVMSSMQNLSSLTIEGAPGPVSADGRPRLSPYRRGFAASGWSSTSSCPATMEAEGETGGLIVNVRECEPEPRPVTVADQPLTESSTSGDPLAVGRLGIDLRVEGPYDMQQRTVRLGFVAGDAHAPFRLTDGVAPVHDFTGAALRQAVADGLARCVFVGMAGKLAKLAAGIMMTHYTRSKRDLDLLAEVTAQAGGSPEAVEAVRRANTARHAYELWGHHGVAEAPSLLCAQVARNLEAFVGGALAAQVLMVDFDTLERVGQS